MPDTVHEDHEHDSAIAEANKDLVDAMNAKENNQLKPTAGVAISGKKTESLLSLSHPPEGSLEGHRYTEVSIDKKQSVLSVNKQKSTDMRVKRASAAVEPKNAI